MHHLCCWILVFGVCVGRKAKDRVEMFSLILIQWLKKVQWRCHKAKIPKMQPFAPLCLFRFNHDHLEASQNNQSLLISAEWLRRTVTELKGTLAALKCGSYFLTCDTNHRPLRWVQHRVLALPLPPLVFGQVPWQSVSWWAHKS